MFVVCNCSVQSSRDILLTCIASASGSLVLPLAAVLSLREGDAMQLDPIVASVAASVQSPDPAEKEKALQHLAQLLDDVYDDAADALCAYLRDAGVIEKLVELLDHPGPIAQMAMFIVGNVASEARDSTD